VHTSRLTSAVAALVATCVVALLIGVVAPATGAASLTKGTVKRIAAKVVKKSAPSLSVAHATTAGDAATLQGQSAAALQSAAYTYTLTPAASFGAAAYGFTGLPAGTYLVTYDVSLGFSVNATGASCYLTTNASAVQMGYTEARVGGTFGNCAGSAVVTTAPGLSFHASGNQPLRIYNQPTIPSTVTFVRLDAVTPRAEQPLP
jgi:hypothetical protein